MNYLMLLDSVDIQAIALIFNIAMIIIYFSKKRIVTSESRKYAILLYTVLISIILDIVSIWGIAHSGEHPVLATILCKLYYYLLIANANLVVVYITNLIYKDSMKKKSFYSSLRIDDKLLDSNQRVFNANDYPPPIKALTITLYVISLIELVIILALPVQFNTTPYRLYDYGAATTFTYACFAVRIICLIVFLIFKWKDATVPTRSIVCVFAVFFVGCSSLHYIAPEILTVSPAFVLTLIIMYFTIQNPDFDIIEQLRSAKKHAEEVNEEKTDFLLSMSHEIRTPLNAIVGYSEILKQNNRDQDINDGVNSILVASNSLLDTVNGILDISKIESNELEIKTNTYKFSKLFDELCLLAKSRINGKNIEFRAWADPNIPNYLVGDFIHVKQVVLNILTNAIKYTKEGYVDFKIDSKISDHFCTLIIKVEDTGIGIKKENINRLFSKFDRLGVEKEMQIEGTGLGLALTKRLVSLMNGKLSVASEYGKGSTFTVELIQGVNTDIPKMAASEKPDVIINAFKGKRVLIVDDNMTGVKVITKILEKYGIIVSSLTTGEECVKEAIYGSKIDLILLDDVMPNMNGVETLKKLKKISGFDVPVVMFTANVITGMREKYLDAGFDEYLAKPVSFEELNDVLFKFLS